VIFLVADERGCRITVTGDHCVLIDIQELTVCPGGSHTVIHRIAASDLPAV
jgi:hypothetical protein